MVTSLRRGLIAGSGVALVAIASGGALATPAQAATAGTPASASVVDSGTVQFTAAAGTTNSLTVTSADRTVTFDDRVAIRAGEGCAPVRGDRTKVRCTTSETTRWIHVAVGDGNDKVTNKSNINIVAYGGAGNDTLTGGSSHDTLYGDAGNDTLRGGDGVDGMFGGRGTDVLHGGPDADYLDGGSGADTLRGGSGSDYANYGHRTAAVVVDLDNARGDDGAKGERDTVGGDIENIIGGHGADILTGNSGVNSISGGAGNDVIRGGAGDDGLVGGSGNDRVYGQGGDDVLLGEPSPPRESGEDLGSDAALDRVDGGTNTAVGDACYVRAAGVVVNCEHEADTTE
jgi:Ca2+-binding RTX toxin-like protein